MARALDEDELIGNWTLVGDEFAELSGRRGPTKLGSNILQNCLGLVNTLMIQDTLALPEWQGVLTDADRRGLTPIFHTNMTPYGEIQLRTDRRLDLTGLPASGS